MNSCTCPQWEPNVYAKHTAERQISMDCPIHGEPTTGQLCARIRELEAELAALREARGVRVKPLVWRNGGFDHDADLIDETETYQIQEGTFWYGAQIHGTSCADNETAKAAAQADYERRIFAALEPAPVAPAEAWQPIETAPKDGQMILVCLPRMMNLIVRARFDTVHGYWLHDYEGEGGVSRYFSLHSGDVWLPMPKPPRALADAGEAG